MGTSASQLPPQSPQSGDGHVSVPRLALSIREACDALGVGWDFWHEQIEPEIRLVRLGRRKLVPVNELQIWLERHSARTLDR
jgi:hypothetical protein